MAYKMLSSANNVIRKTQKECQSQLSTLLQGDLRWHLQMSLCKALEAKLWTSYLYIWSYCKYLVLTKFDSTCNQCYKLISVFVYITWSIIIGSSVKHSVATYNPAPKENVSLHLPVVNTGMEGVHPGFWMNFSHLSHSFAFLFCCF